MSELGDIDPRQVLALALPEGHESGAATVGGYLIELLLVAWDSPDLDPFGNSGWQWDLLKPLAEAGFITIPFDEDGYLGAYENTERKRGEDIISMVIKSLGEPAAPPEMPPLDYQVDVLSSLLAHLRLRLEWIKRGASFEFGDANAKFSPAQVWGRLLRNTAEQRLLWIEGVIGQAEASGRCWMAQHDQVIERQRVRIQELETRVTELGGDLS